MVSDTQNIRPRKIVDEMRTSYLDYAMSVIVARALPDVRDGLKPVHRRILYAMDDLGLRPNAPHKKSARIVGEVLGKYHPHGDVPVYEAMVRMAQDFSLRYPLVDGQGNFGSIDNDPPAAMRYTEVRLSRAAEEMLADLDKQTVDFEANFDDSLNEPLVLPARLPNLMINGSTGIAVGMATNIPPQHLGEIAEAIKILLKNPEAGVDDLMAVVQGPEFPSGAIVFGGTDRRELREMYATGHGRFIMRAVHQVEETARGNRMQIVFTELPYQVNKASLVEHIANLVRDKRLEGIADLRDESDRHGLRVAVELKRDGNVALTLAKLFKMTPLQTSFNANMVALVEGRPRRISLKQALQAHIDHRREIIRRRTEFDLGKARDRHHIVEGLLKAIEKIAPIIKAIRAAESADAAKQALQGRPFLLSERQAQAVLDMQLRRLAALERGKLEEEFQELTETITYLEGLLADSKKIDTLIAEDVTELTELYAGERRTAIVAQDVADFNVEDLIAHQAGVISVSEDGYIKRVPLESYRAQHRGGKGVKGMATRDADLVRDLLVVDTHDSLLMFTDKGRVFSLKGHEVEERSREARGLPLRNLIQIDANEQVTAIVPATDFTHDFILNRDRTRADQEDAAGGIRQCATRGVGGVQHRQRRQAGPSDLRARRRRRDRDDEGGAGRALPGRLVAQRVALQRRGAGDSGAARNRTRGGGGGPAGRTVPDGDDARLRQAHQGAGVSAQGPGRQGHDRAQGDGEDGAGGCAAPGDGQRRGGVDRGGRQVPAHQRGADRGRGTVDPRGEGDDHR